MPVIHQGSAPTEASRRERPAGQTPRSAVVVNPAKVDDLEGLYAHLEQAAGRPLTEAEGDLHRASYVRRILASEGRIAADEGRAGGSERD